jgi:hypothetical protein
MILKFAPDNWVFLSEVQFDGGTTTTGTSPTPEPGSLLLSGAALAGVLLARKKLFQGEDCSSSPGRSAGAGISFNVPACSPEIPSWGEVEALPKISPLRRSSLCPARLAETVLFEQDNLSGVSESGCELHYATLIRESKIGIEDDVGAVAGNGGARATPVGAIEFICELNAPVFREAADFDAVIPGHENLGQKRRARNRRCM